MPSFLHKIILYALSKGEAETTPSDNYIEFLNCNSVKSALLLVLSVAAKEQIAYCMHQNMTNNLLKGLITAQSLLIPKGIIPFETPSAPMNQSLSDFQDRLSTITINGHTILTSSSESSITNVKLKQNFSIPQTTDQLIYLIYNFRLTIAFFLKNTLYAYER